MDLIGKTVRWEGGPSRPGQWFTVLLRKRSTLEGDYWGTVVDPGTYGQRDWEKLPLGEKVYGLDPALLTVIDSEPVTEDEECE